MRQTERDMSSGKPSASNVVRLRPARGGKRAAVDEAVLTQIIAAQSEIARAGLDPLKVVDLITRHSQTMTGSTGAVVEMLKGDELVYWSTSGSVSAHRGFRVPCEGSISGLCLRTGQVLQCDDSEHDPRVNIEACRRVGLRSAILVPLLYEQRTVGVLKVVSDRAYAYTRRDAATLEMFGTFIGATLHHTLEHARALAEAAAAAAGEQEARERHAAQCGSLRALIDTGAISPVFQPIFELGSGRIVGYEGLSRFPEQPAAPDGGWFAAADALGLCEELELACIETIVAVAHRLPADAYLSVNVSPSTLLRDELEGLLARVPGERVVVEITEHSQVADYATLAERVQALRERGWRFAIDDAGAGYASLRHVLRLSPDVIKLDISITRDIDQRLQHRQLAAAIVSFAGETGTALVAEGIETAAERDTLAALGVRYGQGFLLSRPAPV
jgi:EAL domain-containing protein (putative c-di-GMP-specific phosphodiesterase class I)